MSVLIIELHESYHSWMCRARAQRDVASRTGTVWGMMMDNMDYFPTPAAVSPTTGEGVEQANAGPLWSKLADVRLWPFWLDRWRDHTLEFDSQFM